MRDTAMLDHSDNSEHQKTLAIIFVTISILFLLFFFIIFFSWLFFFILFKKRRVVEISYTNAHKILPLCSIVSLKTLFLYLHRNNTTARSKLAVDEVRRRSSVACLVILFN